LGVEKIKFKKMKKSTYAIIFGLLGFAFVAFILVIIGAVLLAAASGFINIPFLTSMLGADKPKDLGVSYDPAAFGKMLQEAHVEMSSPFSNYCFTCPITYSAETVKTDIKVTSEELTSYIRQTNDEKGVFKNLQIKLGTDNHLEASGMLNLTEYGYNYTAPAYASGTIEKASDKTVRIKLDKGEAGRIPVPDEYSREAGTALETLINDQLAKMPNLKIETLEIKDGELHFKGDFPKKITAN
jgi:hypothetical protein